MTLQQGRSSSCLAGILWKNMLYKITFLITFALIALFTIRRSAGVHSAADFSVANRSLSCTGVSWVIIGTLVGGVSTIGTVQG